MIGLALTIGFLVLAIMICLLTTGAYLYHCGAAGRAPVPRIPRREKIDITGGDDDKDNPLPRTRV